MDNLEENIIVNKFLKKLYLYDKITYDHSINVAKYINLYCKFYSVNLDLSESLKYGALMHDIGKLFIDSKILNSSQPLTEHKFTKMRKHTLLGYQYLKDSNISKDIYMYALYHHYRVDNNNIYNFDKYIDKEDLLEGINKEKYSKKIFLMNVCDSYEAMTAKRNYNIPKSRYEALEELYTFRGVQFDEKIVDKFIYMITKTFPKDNKLLMA